MIRTAFLIILAACCLNSSRAAVQVVAGEPATATLSEPFSVDFDPGGVMCGVEFTKSNRVFKLADGKLEFIAGVRHDAEKEKPQGDVHDGADPLKAVFHGMHDIQIMHDGKALLADSFNHRVRLFDLSTGKVSTIAGTGKSGYGGDGGPATAASFAIAMTATLSPDQKRIYVADIGNHRVRKIELASGRIETVAGNGQKGNPPDGGDALASPMGDVRAVTQAKDGALYILLRGGNCLVAVIDGKARTVVNASGRKGYSGDGGPGRDAAMNGPKYVTMDPAGNVLICDTENHCIRRYSPKTGLIERVAGTPPTAGTKLGATLLDTQLRRPHGVRIAPDGMIYVADTYNNRVLRAEYR
jgi:DNA-binding beta-propeller fold protein YncE